LNLKLSRKKELHAHNAARSRKNDDSCHALSLTDGQHRRSIKKEKSMRKTLIATALVAVAFPAFAQQQPARQPANPDANTPAVNSPNSPPNPGAPVAGANSFTEGQARSRIEAKGFKDVSGLQKDDAGVWRGKASQDGKAMNVSVDFQGNMVGK
jgi:hypothetical protein